MPARWFLLAIRGFFGCLVGLLLYQLALRPWLVANGKDPATFLSVMCSIGLLVSFVVLGRTVQVAATTHMRGLRVRYHRAGAASADLSPVLEFLGNLADESGHVVLTLLSSSGNLGLYLEVPEDYAEAAVDLVRQVFPDGEAALLPGPLKVRALGRYFLLLPPLGKPATQKEDTAPPDTVGSMLLPVLQGADFEGEMRWHFFPKGRGVITVAGMHDLRPQLRPAHLPARAYRFPRPVWTSPLEGREPAKPLTIGRFSVSQLLPPRSRWPRFILSMLQAVQQVYWWCPLFDVWSPALSATLSLPDTEQHPTLDSSQLRFPLPADYQLAAPALIVGREDVAPGRPLGFSLAQEIPGHLLLVGMAPVPQRLGETLVEEMARLGGSIVAIGDRFDGMGTLANSLPEQRRAQVLRIAPTVEAAPHISLLHPGGGSLQVGPALRWLEHFLAGEGITRTTHRLPLLTYLTTAARSLPQNPDFDLFGLVAALENAAQMQALLGVPDAGSLPSDLSAFLREEAASFGEFQFQSYLKLLAQKMPMLRETWMLRVTRPPYLDLTAFLQDGGILFCSLPLSAPQVGEQASGGANRQFARYLLAATLNAITGWEQTNRPCLLYLQDAPTYLRTGLPWSELRQQGCLVVVNLPALCDAGFLDDLASAGLYPLVLRPSPNDLPAVAAALNVSTEIAGRIRGRKGLLRSPGPPGSGAPATYTVNALEVCPPDIAPAEFRTWTRLRPAPAAGGPPATAMPPLTAPLAGMLPGLPGAVDSLLGAVARQSPPPGGRPRYPGARPVSPQVLPGPSDADLDLAAPALLGADEEEAGPLDEDEAGPLDDLAPLPPPPRRGLPRPPQPAEPPRRAGRRPQPPQSPLGPLDGDLDLGGPALLGADEEEAGPLDEGEAGPLDDLAPPPPPPRRGLPRPPQPAEPPRRAGRRPQPPQSPPGPLDGDLDLGGPALLGADEEEAGPLDEGEAGPLDDDALTAGPAPAPATAPPPGAAGPAWTTEERVPLAQPPYSKERVLSYTELGLPELPPE